MRNIFLISTVLGLTALLLFNVYNTEVARLHGPEPVLSNDAPSAKVEAALVPSASPVPAVVDEIPDLPPAELEEPGVIVGIAPNETLTDILARYQIPMVERIALSKALKEFQNPRRLRPGRKMELVLSDEPDSNGKRCLKAFRMMIGQDELVELIHTDHLTFAGKRKPFQHDTVVRNVTGTIDSSFFVAARSQGVPRGILTEFYNMLGARVDFQREIRKGDVFHIVYEENNDSPYSSSHAGRMLYASMTSQGRDIGYFRYTTHDGFSGYFDEHGNSVDTRLLKTPLRAGRLSSSFGNRKHPVYGYARMHRGIDFSARRGTPVLAAGDGVVERAGIYGTYGKFIRIRHGEKYMTGYAHLGSYAKGITPGTRVSQGDVIGYVGSTGLTTGPNLHYEVFEYGKRINPMTLKLPPIRALQGEELRRFKEYLKTYQKSAGAQPV